jgi:hypothetical protein
MRCEIWGFHGGDYEECRLPLLRRVAIVRTDVSEEHSASIIRMTRIYGLRTLTVTSQHDDGGDTFLRNVGARAIRCNIPGSGILHSHRPENLKFYTARVLLT